MLNKPGKRFLFIAMSPVGDGLSGGDRIFIELARNLKLLGNSVTIVTWDDGLRMCKRNNLTEKDVIFKILDLHFWPKLGFVINYFARIIHAVWFAFFYSLDSDTTFIYSSSEFWMDVFPSVILRLRFSKSLWVATWFQTAPNPIQGFAEGTRTQRYRFRAFLYWFSQLPVKPFVVKTADFVLVNNEDERKQFPALKSKNKIMVFIGAIDIDIIKSWQKKNTKFEKKYEAVFQGRFHPQKGVVELIDIWGEVVAEKPDAKLAMIGDGPLMEDVRSKIKDLRLEKNITLLGYVFDGDLKYKTFAQSRIVVHPAFYDSGGMASAEAMAFGLPCIGFNLKAYNSYYPKGMIKVPIGDLSAFAQKIVLINRDKKLYNRMQQDAVSLIENNWTWQDRAHEILDLINNEKEK